MYALYIHCIYPRFFQHPLETSDNGKFFGIYLVKVEKRNTKTMDKTCSKLTIKTPEPRHWRRSGFFIVKFEHISHLVDCDNKWNASKLKIKMNEIE